MFHFSEEFWRSILDPFLGHPDAKKFWYLPQIFFPRTCFQKANINQSLLYKTEGEKEATFQSVPAGHGKSVCRRLFAWVMSILLPHVCHSLSPGFTGVVALILCK